MDRRSFLAALGGASTALSGCTAFVGSSDSGPAYDVGMRADAYRPVEFETTVGSTVVWRNTSSRAHTVTAYGALLPEGAAYFASGGFDTEQAARDGYYRNLGGAIDSGDTYAYTFDVAGEFEYFCVPHERAGMVGTVIVEE